MACSCAQMVTWMVILSHQLTCICSCIFRSANPVRDTIKFLQYRDFERDVGGQMKLEAMYSYESATNACQGRRICVRSLL
jgi:hypothetical protein